MASRTYVVPLYFPAVRHVSPGPTCSPVPVSVITSHIRMRALCDHSLHSHTVLSCLNIYDLASGLGPVLLSLLSLAKKPMCSTLNTDRFILATVMSPDVREQTSVSTSSRITGETFSFFLLLHKIWPGLAKDHSRCQYLLTTPCVFPFYCNLQHWQLIRWHHGIEEWHEKSKSFRPLHDHFPVFWGIQREWFIRGMWKETD